MAALLLLTKVDSAGLVSLLCNEVTTILQLRILNELMLVIL